MLEYYGTQLLDELLAYYLPRLRLAEERGYAVQGNKYEWLFEELRHRACFLRQTLLFLEALPRFMQGQDEAKPMEYVVRHTSKFFMPEAIGEIARDAADTHPFFNTGNPYWNEFQEIFEHFSADYDMSNLPMAFVDLCEYTVRAVRLYLQIREVQFKAVDRGKFDELMHMRSTVQKAG